MMKFNSFINVLKNNSLRGGTKSRSLNFEVLRIIAMFLVMIIHYNVPINGAPTWDSIQGSPFKALGIIQLKSISFVCVNVFILVSGYFGISWKLKSFLAFIYQLAFWAAFTYLITLVFGYHGFDTKTFCLRILNCCDANWFYLSYIGLYLFSPVLNAFIGHSDCKTIGRFLVAFYLMAWIFGYVTQQSIEFNRGCSFVSLVGLYICGAFLRKTECRWKTIPAKTYLLLFFVLGWFLAACSIITLRLGFTKDVYGYLNPIVLAEGVFLFLFFAKIEIKSCRNIIMFFSSSALAVLLLHYSPDTCGIYTDKLRWINNNCAVPFILIMFFMLTLFIFAAIVDKLRMASWIVVWNAASHLLQMRKHKNHGHVPPVKV